MASRALKRRNEPPLFSPVFPAEPAPPRQPPMPYFVINHSHAAAAAAGIGMARTRDPSPPPRDARASTAKHPHDSVYSSGSGIVSPVSVGYTRPISELPTPPSHNAQGVQFPFPFPQRQQQQQQHPPFHPAAVRQHAVELPSTKMADMFELPE